MDLLIKALATWRLTKLLMDEDGPLEIFLTMRHEVRLRGDDNHFMREAAKALSCKWCLSVWTGLLMAVLPTVVAKPLALSAAALFLEKHYGKG